MINAGDYECRFFEFSNKASFAIVDKDGNCISEIENVDVGWLSNIIDRGLDGCNFEEPAEKLREYCSKLKELENEVLNMREHLNDIEMNIFCAYFQICTGLSNFQDTSRTEESAKKPKEYISFSKNDKNGEIVYTLQDKGNYKFCDLSEEKEASAALQKMKDALSEFEDFLFMAEDLIECTLTRGYTLDEIIKVNEIVTEQRRRKYIFQKGN